MKDKEVIKLINASSAFRQNGSYFEVFVLLAEFTAKQVHTSIYGSIT